MFKTKDYGRPKKVFPAVEIFIQSIWNLKKQKIFKKNTLSKIETFKIKLSIITHNHSLLYYLHIYIRANIRNPEKETKKQQQTNHENLTQICAKMCVVCIRNYEKCLQFIICFQPE